MTKAKPRKAVAKKEQRQRKKNSDTSTPAPLDSKRATSGRDEKGRFADGNAVGGRFHPGYDPKRNYEGRPKTHDELREMILNIGAEVVAITNLKGETFQAPLAFLMLRDMFMGRDARDHQNILEHGWGKVTQAVEMRTWRDDVIDLLKSGKATPKMVRDAYEESLATELIVAAGVAEITGDEPPVQGDEHKALAA